jgi:dihydroorotase
MDTIKMLLAATTALLLGALAWTWQTQRNLTKDAPATELARIQKQLEEIKREEAILRSEKQLRDMGVTSAPSGNATFSQNSNKDLEEKAAKLREIEERNAALQMELELKEKEANVAKQEAGLIAQNDLEKSDKELRRARQIKEALLMAKVMEFVNDPATGSFVTIQLVMPEHVTVDTVLSVRRKDGIAGNVKVREVVGGEAIADVLPGIGPFSPEPGDELIMAPAF